MTQPMPGKPAEDAENELDIRGLFRTLWAGKLWIIGMGLAFALIALAYTFFARQEWSSTAITDRPTVNMLTVRREWAHAFTQATVHNRHHIH